MIDAGARCANHTTSPAYAICARCGTYVCATCTSYRPDGTFCIACARRSPLGASWLAVIAAASGFVGIGCFPLAPVALVCAVIDLVALATGRAPKEGAKLDAMGIVLGLIATGIWVLILYRHLTTPDALGTDFPMD